MRWKAAILILMYFLADSPVFASENVAKAAPHFIWWSPAPAARQTAGRVGQVLTLKTSPYFSLPQPPEAWLRVTPLYRFNQPGEPEKARWLKGEWASTEPWTLAVQAGEYVKVDVFARAETEGRPHFAQTRLLLYGQSGNEDGNGPGNLIETPDRPEFQISSDGEFYWPQTGHEFTFTLEGLETVGGGLEVWSGQGELLDLAGASAQIFKYTPPHDPVLDRGGYRAEKSLIFVARSPDGASASFTLVVHRSRLAGLNQGAGLAVFTAAFLLCGLGAGLSRAVKVQPC